MMMSPGRTGIAAEGDGRAETGGPVLVGAGRGDGAGKDGHADLAEGFGVAGRAVQGEAGEAEVDGAFADELAQQCPGFVPAAGDDDHVPGLGELQARWMPWLSPGRVQTVKAGPARRAPGQMAWIGGVGDSEAVHGVADVGGGKFGEAVDQVPVGAGEVSVDASRAGVVMAVSSVGGGWMVWLVFLLDQREDLLEVLFLSGPERLVVGAGEVAGLQAEGAHLLA